MSDTGADTAVAEATDVLRSDGALGAVAAEYGPLPAGSGPRLDTALGPLSPPRGERDA